MRKAVILFFIAAMVCLGFFRESSFQNINALLYNKYFHPEPLYTVLPFFDFLNALSYRQLYVLKWILTPALAFVYWFLQRRFIIFLFAEKKSAFWLTILYLSLLLLAGISLGAGWVVGHTDTGYRFSRIFMGLLQSPAPCMVLIPLIYFYKQTQP